MRKLVPANEGTLAVFIYMFIDHLCNLTVVNVHLKSNVKAKGVNKLLLMAKWHAAERLLSSQDECAAWSPITETLVGI